MQLQRMVYVLIEQTFPYSSFKKWRSTAWGCLRGLLTYRCAGCCVLTAVELSQGSSSGPTQTGICTPLCRSELLQPRCWSRSGTPAAAAESEDRLMLIVSFIVKTTTFKCYCVFHTSSLWLSPTTLLPGQTVWTIITNMSQVAFGEMEYHLFHRGLAH